MAKIHKITMYVVDVVDDRVNNRVTDLIGEMAYTNDIFIAAPPETETREFEWDDDVVVNNRDCTREQCEEFYSRIRGVPKNEKNGCN